MMKTKILFIVLLCSATFFSHLSAQDIKEKKWNVFIKELGMAIQTKNMNKIKQYVLPETHVLATIEMDLKSTKKTSALRKSLFLPFENSESADGERVINCSDNDETRAYYFSFKNKEWKLVEIAAMSND